MKSEPCPSSIEKTQINPAVISRFVYKLRNCVQKNHMIESIWHQEWGRNIKCTCHQMNREHFNQKSQRITVKKIKRRVGVSGETFE